MADVRCPMCSKLNPAEAAVCQFCGARLKPLIAGQSDESRPPSRPGDEGMPDWLARIRSEAARGEEPEGEGEEAGEAPDWLRRLRPAEAGEEGPPEGEVPEWLSGVEEAVEPPVAETEREVPDWLARIRERQKVEEPVIEEPPPPPEEDWIARLRKESRPLTPPPEPVEPSKPISKPAFTVEPLVGDESAEWLKPSEWGGPPKTPEPPKPPRPEPTPPRIPPVERKPPPSGPAAEPDWFKELKTPADDNLPHVPALISEPEAEAPAAPADFDLGSIELPDWLSDLKAEAPAPKPPPPHDVHDLAPATLPAWLEAMRPMETFRPVVEIQPEEDQVVEAAGPLAGLRGILLAEPAVAMPRQTTSAVARLTVTERQFALGDLLRRMVEEEEREAPARPAARRRLPLMRWAVALVVFLGVALPSFIGGPSFPIPTLVPPGLPSLVQRVNTLPVDRPALVVVEYEPAFAGELEAIAGPLLDHLVSRGIRVATVSTRASGPPLADRLMSRVAAPHDAALGADYVHLGYLPGGPAAVQLFASDPRGAVTSGFLIPEGVEGNVWNSPVLSGTQRLSDFSAVIVLAAGTEIARTWVEQAHPWLGETPLIMVLSAGVEPLIRPYYESLEPQVDGILAGMPAAVAYEQANGRPEAARALWNAFGSGMLVAELVLVVGGIYGLASFLFRPGAG
ncbi:MAG: hypothetical protein AB1449_01675 [Chloroflexota bacterium]